MPVDLLTLRSRDTATPAESRVLDFLSGAPGVAFDPSEVARALREEGEGERTSLPSVWSLTNAALEPWGVAWVLEELTRRGRVARVRTAGRTWYHIVPMGTGSRGPGVDEVKGLLLPPGSPPRTTSSKAPRGTRRVDPVAPRA